MNEGLFSILPLISSIVFAICLFLVGRRLNSYTAWIAFVPIANVFYLFHLGGMSFSRSLLFLLWIPLVGVLISFVVPPAGLLIILGSIFGAGIAANIGLSRAMGKVSTLGILGVLPVISTFWYLYLAFGPYERINTRGQRIVSESDIYVMVENGLNQGLSREQILEYAAKANVSTLQVKRALFEIQKQQKLAGRKPI